MKVNVSDVLNNLSGIQTRIQAAAKVYGDTAAAQLEAEAKSNAPWNDITGNSRQTIQGDCQMLGNVARISISGFTPHFKYLELAHEKRFAILEPTIINNSSRIFEGFKRIID